MSREQPPTVVSGTYQTPGHSAVYRAQVSTAGGAVDVLVENEPALSRAGESGYSIGPVISGLPVEMHFPDGAVFIPDDHYFRWPGTSNRHNLLSWLESSRWIVAAAALLTPLAVWWIVAVAMPAAAVRSVAIIPDSVPREMGRETLLILDKWFLEPSLLDVDAQAELTQRWENTVRSLDLPKEKYRLQFRASETFGANAMALPDGTVIVTDDLVTRLRDNPNAIVAVMLHEIGHVEHQHSLKMVAQSVATGLFFAVFFGDIEGAGELVIGAGSSLLQNAFSREMETEADHFAFDKLEALNISPAAFADAMTAIIAEDGDKQVLDNHENHDNDETTWTDYLSTHPATQARIKAARERAEALR